MRRLRHFLASHGTTLTSSPVQPSLRLTAVVAVVATIAALLMAVTMSTTRGDVALIVGASIMFLLLEVTSVDLEVSGAGVSASILVGVTFAVIGGPWAVAGLAAGYWTAQLLRYGLAFPAIKMVFNAALNCLTFLTAWAVFDGLAGGNGSIVHGGVVGVAASTTEWVVNASVLGAVLSLNPGWAGWKHYGRHWVGFLPFTLGYGWAAYGAVVLFNVGGLLAVTFLLVPVALVQLFLLRLGRQTAVHSMSQSAHAREADALTLRAVRASEIERRRIAHDLHDQVAQELAILSSQLQLRGDRLGGEEGAALQRAASAAAEANQTLRSLLVEINPPDFRHVTLHEALADLVAPAARAGIITSIDIAPEAEGVSAPLGVVYRVLQEAVRNTVRHAQASTIAIRVWDEAGRLCGDASDDGRGFETGSYGDTSTSGLGLGFVRSLAEDAGGTFVVSSEAGLGTVVRVTIPATPYSQR